MSEIAQTQTITIKLRLRDKHATELNRQARAVTFVWNYVNETQQKAARACRKWLSAFDLQRLTSGASKELDIHSHTIGQVCCAYDRSRKANKKAWLRWRSRKSLGWVPFNTGRVTVARDGIIKFRGIEYEAMHWREHLRPGVLIGAGSFNQDAQGHWFFNAPIKIEIAKEAPRSYVGVDLGLSALAALSDGTIIEAPRLYRASEAKLATAQRARKATKRIRNIHAKIANRRKDFLHKVSADLAKKYGLIIVGDVSPKKIAQTRFAKSVLDAGWATFKNMLRYKSHLRAGACLEVSERLSSQTCSECGSLPPSRPRGIAGLSKRVFRCDCGVVLDRDVNAARNILRIGRNTLVGGIHA